MSWGGRLRSEDCRRTVLHPRNRTILHRQPAHDHNDVDHDDHQHDHDDNLYHDDGAADHDDIEHHHDLDHLYLYNLYLDVDECEHLHHDHAADDHDDHGATRRLRGGAVRLAAAVRQSVSL